MGIFACDGGCISAGVCWRCVSAGLWGLVWGAILFGLCSVGLSDGCGGSVECGDVDALLVPFFLLSRSFLLPMREKCGWRGLMDVVCCGVAVVLQWGFVCGVYCDVGKTEHQVDSA